MFGLSFAKTRSLQFYFLMIQFIEQIFTNVFFYLKLKGNFAVEWLGRRHKANS